MPVSPGVRISARIGFVVVMFVAIGLGWNRLVEGAIFQPSPGGISKSHPTLALLADRGILVEDVFLTTDDALRIHAYWVIAERAAAPATRAILFLHGNAGNASHRLGNAAELAALGVGVLLLDYRGYGRSEGRATETGVYRDARAALAHLTEERGFGEERIVLFGRSLGGAVAVDLARGRALAGVVLESTFTSVADVAEMLGGPVLAYIAGSRFRSDAKVGQLRAPVLFFHGDRDRVVAYELGRRLFELAPSPKSFETIPGAGHNDTVRVGGPAYFSTIRVFLDRVAPDRGASAAVGQTGAPRPSRPAGLADFQLVAGQRPGSGIAR